MNAATPILLGVCGYPILHSFTPQLHLELGKDSHVPVLSTRIISSDFEQALKISQSIGITGLNITSPFKKQIQKFKLSQEAELLGAANTILFRDQPIVFNTDIFGVKQSITPYLSTIDLTKKVLILGAGGAATAAAFAIKELNLECIILNRTPTNGASITNKTGFINKALNLENLTEALLHCEIIINTIPHNNEIVPLKLLNETHILLDAIYNYKTPITHSAEKARSRIISGLSWLQFQGIKSFEIFSGKKLDEKRFLFSPPTKTKKHISLIGMPGSGKTEVGKLLAQYLDFEFIDVDYEIEQLAGKSINLIFQQDGEDRFRALEIEIFSKVIDQKHIKIISCGGGSVESPSIKNLLKTKTMPFWIFATKPTLVGRISLSQSRPLFHTNNIRGIIDEIYAQRFLNYFETAYAIINNDSELDAANTVKNVAIALSKEINNYWGTLNE